MQPDKTDPFMKLEILNCLGNPSLILEELVRRPREGYCFLPPRCENMQGHDVKKSLLEKFPSKNKQTWARKQALCLKIDFS